MIHTVEDAVNRTAFLLGDENKRTFKDASLTTAVQLAWEQIYNAMLNAGLSTIELVQTYTLPASTTELLPLTAGISNFGEIIRMEESAGAKFREMEYVRELPQDTPMDRLRLYQWRNERFYFIGATSNVPLKITYQSSGELPTTGSLGLDGVLMVLSKLAASIAGPPKGLKDLALKYERDVNGDGTAKNPGSLSKWIRPKLRTKQLESVQLPAYQAGGSLLRQTGGRPPLFDTEV